MLDLFRRHPGPRQHAHHVVGLSDLDPRPPSTATSCAGRCRPARVRARARPDTGDTGRRPCARRPGRAGRTRPSATIRRRSGTRARVTRSRGTVARARAVVITSLKRDATPSCPARSSSSATVTASSATTSPAARRRRCSSSPGIRISLAPSRRRALLIHAISSATSRRRARGVARGDRDQHERVGEWRRGRAAQRHRREQADDQLEQDDQRVALVTAGAGSERHQRAAVEVVLGPRRRPAVGVEHPPRRDLGADLDRVQNPTLGDLAERHVEHDRKLRSRHRQRQRVVGQPPFEAAVRGDLLVGTLRGHEEQRD